MMRDNIIVKTKGECYKEKRDENTTSVFQTFFRQELKVANAEQISIPWAHRMGWAGNGFNRMVISKVPQAEDQERIFMNASVLNDTEFSISKQLPHKVEERRIFGWAKYKNARQDGR